MLLAASYYFYMCWKAEYAILIILSTVIDYYASIKMEQCASKSRKRNFLLLSLGSNLGLLFIFKYLNFVSTSAQAVIDCFGLSQQIPLFDLVLPVGISFYTFQTLSYTIDVYRGHREAERDFAVFALYVSFFPQLVAGPIERSTHLMPQFKQHHKFSGDNFVRGLTLVLWGFFMKLVIADQVSPYVDNVYNNPESYTGGHFICATYFFAFQIFCDFAGYSSIAIGVSRIMGIDMMTNFSRPYFADTVKDFWRRWHISLSTWFRDYLYIPLGGNRGSVLRTYCNLFIVFVVSGIWHGANWTFAIWGALHGGYLIIGVLKDRFLPKFVIRSRAISTFCVFNLACFAWIFFRANNVMDAFYVVCHLFDFPELNLGYAASIVLPFTGDYSSLAMFVTSIGFILVLEIIHFIWENKSSALAQLWEQNSYVKGIGLAVLLVFILFFGNFNSSSFIYFQF